MEINNPGVHLLSHKILKIVRNQIILVVNRAEE